MKLSILICSLEERAPMLAALEQYLTGQIVSCRAQKKVEIIHDIDSGQTTTGAKRNRLLAAARGEYIAFIDDDDWVSANYVEAFLNAAKSGADCFAINGVMTTNGNSPVKWRIALGYEWIAARENGVEVYLRYPNHITAVKREHALAAGFPDKSNFEDKEYADRLKNKALLKTQAVIAEPMYEYRYVTGPKRY